MDSFAVALVVASLAVSSYFLLRGDKNNGRKLPPGPRALPILGNLHQLGDFPHKLFAEWAKTYGDLTSVWFGSQLVVVINTHKAAKDVLVSHGSKHSSRFHSILTNDILTRESRGFAFRQNDDYWKLHRRVAAQALAPKAVRGYQPLIEKEAGLLVLGFIDDATGGKETMRHFQRFSLSTIMNVSFGISIADTGDKYLDRISKLMDGLFDLSNPAKSPHDFIPLLRLFPNPLNKSAEQCRDGLEEVFGQLISELKERIERGTDVDCMVGRVLKDEEGKTIGHLDLTWLAIVIVGAGIETTATTLAWLFCILAVHPEVSAKLHEEMDRVVGRDRLATPEDEASLPYLTATLWEINRFRPAHYLGVPHYSTEDDEYNGYFIPKDTIILTNIKSMSQEPTIFAGSDPNIFNPSRYAEGTPAADWNYGYVFGAGRRACVGLHLAQRELFMAFAYLVWATKWEPAAGGVDTEALRAGLTNPPVRSEVVFKERFEGAAKKIAGGM
ncbi:hypothetical protein HK104_000938 [Borealophlyctis nickersoniae]|nr:hypothetical protein HK104_000938 [Borealophlyctis nickersoniae]